MRFDPTIEVTCDECGGTVMWEPEYTYNDWTGKSGQYDTSDRAFLAWKKSEGWEGGGEKDICDSCAAVDRED